MDLRIGRREAAGGVVDGAPVGAGEDGVVHRLEPLQGGRPSAAALAGEDPVPDPVALALEELAVEGGQNLGAQEVPGGGAMVALEFVVHWPAPLEWTVYRRRHRPDLPR